LSEYQECAIRQERKNTPVIKSFIAKNQSAETWLKNGLYKK